MFHCQHKGTIVKAIMNRKSTTPLTTTFFLIITILNGIFITYLPSSNFIFNLIIAVQNQIINEI